MMLLVIMQIYVQCVQQHACVCVCVRISHLVFCKTERKKIFYLLPNSMWQGLLLDPLLSLFGQSGGRHFKLLLDEVRVVITWLRSSIHVMCTCMRMFLTWIFFPSLRISAVNSMVLSGCSALTALDFMSELYFAATYFRSLKSFAELVQQFVQLQFQLFVNELLQP